MGDARLDVEGDVGELHNATGVTRLRHIQGDARGHVVDLEDKVAVVHHRRQWPRRRDGAIAVVNVGRSELDAVLVEEFKSDGVYPLVGHVCAGVPIADAVRPNYLGK